MGLTKRKMKGFRVAMVVARILSAVFTPFYLPVVGLLFLFIFSYLRYLPWLYKTYVLVTVFFFTVLMPSLLIRLYRHNQGWSRMDIGHKERRMVPYVISIICYTACSYTLNSLHMPHYIRSIVVAALVVQVVCALINVWWKISTHTASIGGVAGAIYAFANIFGFNPIWWLCVTLLVAGLLGTSRMVLRQHSLSQVTAGFLVGVVTATETILLM